MEGASSDVQPEQSQRASTPLQLISKVGSKVVTGGIKWREVAGEHISPYTLRFLDAEKEKEFSLWESKVRGLLLPSYPDASQEYWRMRQFGLPPIVIVWTAYIPLDLAYSAWRILWGLRFLWLACALIVIACTLPCAGKVQEWTRRNGAKVLFVHWVLTHYVVTFASILWEDPSQPEVDLIPLALLVATFGILAASRSFFAHVALHTAIYIPVNFIAVVRASVQLTHALPHKLELQRFLSPSRISWYQLFVYHYLLLWAAILASLLACYSFERVVRASFIIHAAIRSSPATASVVCPYHFRSKDRAAETAKQRSRRGSVGSVGSVSPVGSGVSSATESSVTPLHNHPADVSVTVSANVRPKPTAQGSSPLARAVLVKTSPMLPPVNSPNGVPKDGGASASSGTPEPTTPSAAEEGSAQTQTKPPGLPTNGEEAQEEEQREEQPAGFWRGILWRLMSRLRRRAHASDNTLSQEQATLAYLRQHYAISKLTQRFEDVRHQSEFSALYLATYISVIRLTLLMLATSYFLMLAYSLAKLDLPSKRDRTVVKSLCLIPALGFFLSFLLSYNRKIRGRLWHVLTCVLLFATVSCTYFEFAYPSRQLFFFSTFLRTLNAAGSSMRLPFLWQAVVGGVMCLVQIGVMYSSTRIVILCTMCYYISTWTAYLYCQSSARYFMLTHVQVNIDDPSKKAGWAPGAKRSPSWKQAFLTSFRNLSTRAFRQPPRNPEADVPTIVLPAEEPPKQVEKSLLVPPRAGTRGW